MKTLNDIPSNALSRARLNLTLIPGGGQAPIDIQVEDISYDDVGNDPIVDFIGYLPTPNQPYRLYLWSAYQFESWEEAQNNGALYPLDHLDFDTLDFRKGVLADLVETLAVVRKCFGSECVEVVALPIPLVGAIEP